MLKSKLLHQAASLGAAEFPFSEVIKLFGHSIILGTILALIGYVSALISSGNSEKSSDNSKLEHINAAATILFLCVGMTGVIILVNNNLARAFAIGAALSLMRFRAKIGKTSTNTHLLFGVLAGIACGLNEMPVAWTAVSAYIIIQFVLFGLTMALRKKKIS